jgi:glucose-6-phosphate 1-epimerase
LVLAAPDGARAEIYLHGAHVASWVPAHGVEQLFLSPKSEFRPGATVHGGIPVIFPQFAGLGPLPMHGFVRDCTWTFEAAHLSGAQAVAAFRLADSGATRRIWPHSFLAELRVGVGGAALEVSLAVTNTGPGPFSFMAALHTYFAVADVRAAAVEGAAGLCCFDKAAGGVEGFAPDAPVRFPREVDTIFYAVPGPLRLVEPARTLTIAMAGFSDAVVWNPGRTKGPTIADLEPDHYRRFVCVEAASIAAPVRLAPGERWQGAQMMGV